MSKSANYCYAQLSQNTGLLLLVEVAARPHNELYDAKYDADVLCKAKNALCVQIRVFVLASYLVSDVVLIIVPTGGLCRSTKGVGRVQPVDWKDCYEALGNEELKGVVMPSGPSQDLNSPGVYLQYNEVCSISSRVAWSFCHSLIFSLQYIVYDTAQSTPFSLL